VTPDALADRATVEQWLFDDFCSGLADALSAMLPQPPVANWKRQEPAPGVAEFLWRQPLAPLAGELLLAGGQTEIGAIGRQVMANLGVETASPEELAATAREVFGQAFGRVARSLTSRLGSEVTVGPGSNLEGGPSAISPGAAWAAATITAGNERVSLGLGISPDLAEAILAMAQHAPQSATPPAPEAAPAPPVARAGLPAVAGVPPPEPQLPSLYRLLDVELPVSVSFGKARIQLKDLLKLTNGSIIELSRSVVEPVDVMINNVVIARGEVVVVEGNFGVRIERVLSRRERLEALP
jgi:flagellar motor switch protein FliN/FliY